MSHKRANKPHKCSSRTSPRDQAARRSSLATLSNQLACARESRYFSSVVDFLASEKGWTIKPPSIRFSVNHLRLLPRTQAVTLGGIAPPSSQGPSASASTSQTPAFRNHEQVFLQLPSAVNRNALQRRLFVRFALADGNSYDLELRIVTPEQFLRSREKDAVIVHQMGDTTQQLVASDDNLRMSLTYVNEKDHGEAIAYELAANCRTGVLSFYLMPHVGSRLRVNIHSNSPLSRVNGVQMLRIDNNKLVVAEGLDVLAQNTPVVPSPSASVSSSFSYASSSSSPSASSSVYRKASSNSRMRRRRAHPYSPPVATSQAPAAPVSSSVFSSPNLMEELHDELPPAASMLMELSAPTHIIPSHLSLMSPDSVFQHTNTIDPFVGAPSSTWSSSAPSFNRPAATFVYQHKQNKVSALPMPMTQQSTSAKVPAFWSTDEKHEHKTNYFGGHHQAHQYTKMQQQQQYHQDTDEWMASVIQPGSPSSSFNSPSSSPSTSPSPDHIDHEDSYLNFLQ